MLDEQVLPCNIMKCIYNFSIIILTFLAPNYVIGQAQFPTGIQLKDEVEHDSLAGTIISLETGAELPKGVDLSPYCPTAGHQGDIQSCVGWAAGYAAMTIQHAIQDERTDKREINRLAFSPHFIYNQIKLDGCNSNSRIYEALRFLQKKGNCHKRDFPVDTNNCQSLPSTMVQHRARFYRIKEYQKLFSQDSKAEEKCQLVKQALSLNFPVVIGMKINQHFATLSFGDQYWWPKIGNTAPAGGHALVVVGYDESRSAFLLFNSWGEEWGNKGYIWMQYEAFAKFCKYGYIFSIFSSPPDVEITGKVTVTYRDRISKEFVPVQARLKDTSGQYLILGDHWTTDSDLFRIALEVPEGVFAYQLSLNEDSKGRLVWSMENWHQDTIVSLPERGAYQYSAEGEEVLCFLFNFQPIESLSNYLSLLRYAQGTPYQRLVSVMKDKEIALKDIKFKSEDIAFSANVPFSPKTVLPIIVIIRLKAE